MKTNGQIKSGASWKAIEHLKPGQPVVVGEQIEPSPKPARKARRNMAYPSFMGIVIKG